jgi:hypothetical protein
VAAVGILRFESRELGASRSPLPKRVNQHGHEHERSREIGGINIRRVISHGAESSGLPARSRAIPNRIGWRLRASG